MITTRLLCPALALAVSPAFADRMYDLDDVADWPMVKMEVCMDAALDLFPGHVRKLELKMEGDDPTYEFEIKGEQDTLFKVECNAEEGFITEVERSVSKDDAVFGSIAKITEQEARARALAIHPGKVWNVSYEIGMTGEATYEFDIQSKFGYEVDVDVDAVDGTIEEANIKMYEIGKGD